MSKQWSWNHCFCMFISKHLKSQSEIQTKSKDTCGSCRCWQVYLASSFMCGLAHLTLADLFVSLTDNVAFFFPFPGVPQHIWFQPYGPTPQLTLSGNTQEGLGGAAVGSCHGQRWGLWGVLGSPGAMGCVFQASSAIGLRLFLWFPKPRGKWLFLCAKHQFFFLLLLSFLLSTAFLSLWVLSDHCNLTSPGTADRAEALGLRRCERWTCWLYLQHLSIVLLSDFLSG